MIRWLWLLLLPALAFAETSAPDSPTDTQAARTQSLQKQLEEARRILEDRNTIIQQDMKKIQEALAESEPQTGESLSSEKIKERDRLSARRTALQNELTYLQQAVRGRESALDTEEFKLQTLRELELFKKEASHRTIYFGPAEIAALKAQMDLARSLQETVEHFNAAREQQFKIVQEKLDHEESADNRQVLLADRARLNAQIDAARVSVENQKAQVQLLETQLRIASPATAATSLPATTTGPAFEKQAESKLKIAAVLEKEAHGGFEEAKRQLQDIAAKMKVVRENDDVAENLRDDREYWSHKRSYEDRRLRYADGEKRAAVEKREVARIQRESDAANAELAVLQKTKSLSQDERDQKAAEYRKHADETLKTAAALEVRVENERPNNDLWPRLHATMDKTEEALRERLLRQGNTAHYSRMMVMLDTERQQVNNLMNLSEVINLTMTRQVLMMRSLADLCKKCADTLVPPQPSFWQRHAHVLESIRIVLIAFLVMYLVRTLVWVGQRLTRYIGRDVVPGRFSVKRVETLFSFFGSIAQLFVWLFALIMVLNEFGFDPAKSTGVIGLVGLVLAGMFQDLVIDFVKGLDIITGRHYSVGDFVELNGKTGHVIDFSVKHTRIRTASGQEYNLPNSKCIPSRRFPDGYVDNYVDIVLKKAADITRAKRVIAPICHNISRRIEQVKDEAVFVDRLPGTRPNCVILRYRIRILPACDWIITSQFIPDVKAVLAEEDIELSEEPTFFFINRIQKFRQLFSRELSEEEILREVQEEEPPLPEKPAEAAADPPESTVLQAEHS